jgi:hypothetical protein
MTEAVNGCIGIDFRQWLLRVRHGVM